MLIMFIRQKFTGRLLRRNEGNVGKWFQLCKKCRTNVHDEKSSGYPSLVMDDLKEKVTAKIKFIKQAMHVFFFFWYYSPWWTLASSKIVLYCSSC